MVVRTPRPRLGHSAPLAVGARAGARARSRFRFGARTRARARTPLRGVGPRPRSAVEPVGGHVDVVVAVDVLNGTQCEGASVSVCMGKAQGVRFQDSVCETCVKFQWCMNNCEVSAD